MSYSRIGQVVLYIIVIITIPIMILFFSGSSLVNQEEYDSKVDKIENPGGSNVMQDLQSADSLGVVRQSVPSASGSAPELTFIERLVYLKTDIPLVWGYVLLIASLIIAFIFPVIYIIKHPANLLRTLFLLIGVAALVFLAYFVASGKPMEILGYTGTANSNYNILKLIDTGLIFSYFLFILALGTILYSEVRNYFR